MNNPEQQIIHSRTEWLRILLATSNYNVYRFGGLGLFAIAAPTEILQLMELNKHWFANGYDVVSATGWWLNFALATGTVFALGVLIHQLLEWMTGNSRALLYAATGAMALVIIFVTPLMLGDGTGSGGEMGSGTRTLAGATAFAASVIRSPLVVLMALVAALSVRVAQRGIQMCITHRGALAAVQSLDEAMKIMDDALEDQQSRPRRKSALLRDQRILFAATFSKQEQTRMDTTIGLAKGTVMAGEDFITQLEEGLEKSWDAHDPAIRTMAQAISPKDIDLALVADEVGNLSAADKATLVAHAAAHKRAYSERRIYQALAA